MFTTFLSSETSIPLRFPFRLHELLTDAEHNGSEHIISWLPCCTMFKIHDQTKFTKEIMPKYCRHSRYKSFLRQLSMYKFQRVTEGPNKGAYKHPSFQKNRMPLCRYINRGVRDAWLENEKEETRESCFTLQDDYYVYYNKPLPVKDYSCMLSLFDKCKRVEVSHGCLLISNYGSPLSLNTPEDILDKIISTFGSKSHKSRPMCMRS